MTEHTATHWDLLARSVMTGQVAPGLARKGQLRQSPPAGQQLQSSLIQLIEPGLRGPLFELDVAEPALDGELVPHNFLLVGEVFFILPGR